LLGLITLCVLTAGRWRTLLTAACCRALYIVVTMRVIVLAWSPPKRLCCSYPYCRYCCSYSRNGYQKQHCNRFCLNHSEKSQRRVLFKKQGCSVMQYIHSFYSKLFAFKLSTDHLPVYLVLTNPARNPSPRPPLTGIPSV
jgi:hypothetical protein